MITENKRAGEAILIRPQSHEKAHEPVRTGKHKTDQIIPSVSSAAVSGEPAKREVPLFIETLFKAREFDPL